MSILVLKSMFCHLPYFQKRHFQFSGLQNEGLKEPFSGMKKRYIWEDMFVESIKLRGYL